MPKKEKHTPKQPQSQTEQTQSEFYEVDSILEKRLTDKGVLYLIRWKNYPEPKDFTWEPVQHLTEVEDMIREFNNAEINKRKKTKAEQPKPIRIVRKEESEEEEPQKEQNNRKRTHKQRQPSCEKSDNDGKLTSGHEDNEEEQEIRPRKIQPKRVETRRMERRIEPKKIVKAIKAEKDEIERYWQKDGCELGRICKHFLEDGKLVFVVNVNKGDLVCGIVALKIDEIHSIDSDKLVAYMENWARNHLIEKEMMKTQEYKDFEKYWRSVD